MPRGRAELCLLAEQFQVEPSPSPAVFTCMKAAVYVRVSTNDQTTEAPPMA